MPLLLEWGEEIDLSCERVAETVFLILLLLLSNNIFVVVVMMLQNHQVMVTSFGCCWYNGGAPQSLDCWSSCNIWWKMSARGWRGIVILLWKMYSEWYAKSRRRLVLMLIRAGILVGGVVVVAVGVMVVVAVGVIAIFF